MSAADMIISAFLDGMRLAITAEGRLHYSGTAEVVTRWLPEIREIIVGNYRLIYFIVEQNRIDILTVYHSSRILNIKEIIKHKP